MSDVARIESALTDEDLAGQFLRCASDFNKLLAMAHERNMAIDVEFETSTYRTEPDQLVINRITKPLFLAKDSMRDKYGS